MHNSEGSPLGQRGVAARIGLCLFNLVHPGFGLIRLARYRTGFALIVFNLAVSAGLLTVYQSASQLTYRRFIAVAVVAVCDLLVVWGGSIVLTWRWSARVSPRGGWLWRWYGLFFLWTVLAGLFWPSSRLVKLNYRNFYAPSSSMAPTLQPGDRFVGKMQDIDPIARGDVVIVRKGAVDYVKRVVGVPGDTVAMRDGIVLLNGTWVPQQALSKIHLNEGDGPQEATRLRERFPGEAHAHEIYDLGPNPQDTASAVTLGNRQYFMLGDNRDNSLDSRFDTHAGGMGIVDQSHILGRILFRYWRKGVGLGEGQL